MIKCAAGHYYNGTRFASCPYCNNVSDKYAEERKRVTVAMPANNLSVEEVAKLVSSGGKEKTDEARTIGIFSSLKGNDYVTGWLVCIAGSEYGRDFRLHHGFNRLGRRASMDVVLSNDELISEDTHCQVVYEDKANVFYLVPVKGNLVYLNGTAVFEAVRIKTGDKIEVGETILQFITFCEGERRWEEK